MKELEQIEQELGPGLSPHTAADYRVTLSGLYSRMSGELQDILAVKPMKWMMMRKEVKTNRDADMLWDGSSVGIREMQLKLQMKRIDKINSALSSFLRVSENEAKNNY